MWFVILETKNRSSVELEMFELMVPTRWFRTYEASVDRAGKAAARETVKYSARIDVLYRSFSASFAGYR